MPRLPTRRWALLAVAVLAAGLGLGAATVAPDDGWSTHGRMRPTSFTAAPAAPFEAIVPADVGRVLVGRLGNPHENPRAGPLAALLLATLLGPALPPAFGPARVRARPSWLSPGRGSIALRAPPRSRLV
jgi:hypothetical protein